MKKRSKRFILVVVSAFAASVLRAQDGNTGINQANTMVRSYYPTAVNLLYAIGAIAGLIGAIKVYKAMSDGEPHVNRLAASWFGGCVFLVVVATVIKSFFGI